MSLAATSPVTRIARLLGTLPDLLTAAACIVVWISPFAFGTDGVRTVVLMLLMEFLLVHGTGFFTAIAFADTVAKYKRLLLMAGLLCFYALFLMAICALFDATWPVWIFLWLVLSKVAWIFLSSRDRAQEARQQLQAWAFSTVAYLGSVFAGLLLPLPQLGLTDAVIPQLGMSGSGLWVDHPHTAVASLAMYYLASAWFKWLAGRPSASA